MDSLQAFLASKRIKALIAGGVSSLVAMLKLDPQVAQPLAMLIMGAVSVYVMGQSYVDAKTGGATSHSAPKKEGE